MALVKQKLARRNERSEERDTMSRIPCLTFEATWAKDVEKEVGNHEILGSRTPRKVNREKEKNMIAVA